MARTQTLGGSPPVSDDRLPGAGGVDEGSRQPPADPATNSGGGNSGLTRVTVNLTKQAVEALDQVAAVTGYSKTDTINRALQIYAIVQEIMAQNGGVLQVLHDNGARERVHIV
jgi:hypothetical protein